MLWKGAMAILGVVVVFTLSYLILMGLLASLDVL